MKLYATAGWDLKRFFSRVNVAPDAGACWFWTGALQGGGYGSIRWRGRLHGAHQVAYELFVGQVPEGLLLRHRCDQRRCVNPQHLEVGTHQDNMNDMAERGRRAFGPRLSRPGELNPSAKLKSYQVEEIRRLYALRAGDQRDLARRFGVSQHAISRIVRGEGWRHITDPPP